MIFENAIIGNDCNICSYVFNENQVKVGNRATIKNASLIYDGFENKDDDFIGHRVVLANDKYPRSKVHLTNYAMTIVQNIASIRAR